MHNELLGVHRGISCLLPVYKNDNPAHLWLALDSLVRQTRAPNELVIVEDGPITPELSDVIDDFRPKISMVNVKLPNNLGLGLALRAAIYACSFDLVARMDADDIARTDRLALQEKIMLENPRLVLMGGSIEEFSKVKGDLSRVRHVPQTDVAIRKGALMRNPFCHMSVIFRKCAVLAAGNYRHRPGFEDYDLWLRMLKLPGEFLNLDEILVDVRIGNGLLERRRGWHYLLSEMHFLKSSWQHGLISSPDILFSFFVRIPARFLPAFALDYLYSKFLRTHSKRWDLTFWK